MKIKIGESWGTEATRDIDRVRVAREAVGPDTELYVDANGAYTAAQAVRLMAAVADADVRWLEEPVTSDDLAGLARVRAGVRADVAAGEYGCDLTYFERMCAAGAVDCLQADASRCGGITEWLRVAAVAAAHHLQLSGHCAPHLHAHAAAAIPNLRHLEWFHDHVRIESGLFDGALDPAGGVVRPDPARPGHGLGLRPRSGAAVPGGRAGDPTARGGGPAMSAPTAGARVVAGTRLGWGGAAAGPAPGGAGPGPGLRGARVAGRPGRGAAAGRPEPGAGAGRAGPSRRGRARRGPAVVASRCAGRARRTPAPTSVGTGRRRCGRGCGWPRAPGTTWSSS